MAGVLINCIRGPRLFRIHRNERTAGHLYQPNFLEATGDSFIKVIRFCWSLSCWTSPILLTVLYRRGYFTLEGVGSLSKLAISILAIYGGALFIRGIGRFVNPEYIIFIDTLTAAKRNFNGETKRKLLQYDPESWAFPVDFKWNDGSRSDHGSRVGIPPQSRGRPRNMAGKIAAIPCHILSYIFAHTFGRRMVYPGTTALVNALVGPTLTLHRAKLIEERQGVRAKLETSDGDHIDSMFVDRRMSASPNGETLVVCSEGNSGFYEIGCTVTPLEAGYSVLGWNHPGFAGSSGIPFPSRVQSSIDVVMQYAIHRLGFRPDQIILFAWSIGGYPASWAAMNYPDVKWVLLDATFDSLLPLAIARMPQFARDLVSLTIRSYMNLTNGDQLCRYPGPVLLIRRSKDEMITTVDPSAIYSNRGNDLLVQLLQYRYPKLVDSGTLTLLRNWLSMDNIGQAQLYTSLSVDEKLCQTALVSFHSENPDEVFPSALGEGITESLKKQLVLYLAKRYMIDFDSTHCSPLPMELFNKPWDISAE